MHSSGSTSLDAATCRIMVERAAFRPGSADRVYSRHVNWVLPVRAPEGSLMPNVAGDFVIETEMVIGTNGIVESCRVVEATISARVNPCALTAPGLKMGTGYVKDGKPVKAIMRRRASQTMTFVQPKR